MEDSAFLLYAGQLRSRFDQRCFPPKEKGGDGPFDLHGTLATLLGEFINPAVMAKPKVFAKVVARVKKWSPKAPQWYDPGYEYKERKTERDAQAAAEPNRAKLIRGMEDLSALLNDPQYFAAFQTVEAYDYRVDGKFNEDAKRPTKEEKEKATATMKRIAKEKGLKGFVPSQ